MDRFDYKNNHKYHINNNIRQLVILNEVKNLSLHRCTLFSFVGQMLRFAQHDSKNRSV